jgi:hypothetical protein
MQTINVEFLMDHKTGMGSFYDPPPIEIVLQDYLKAVPDLTIFTSNQEITEQTQMLTTQMESKDNEIQALTEQMTQSERLTQAMKEIIFLKIP